MSSENLPGILLKGYTWFHEKFREQQTDVIKTRLFFKTTWVIKGREAARLFYDQGHFIRRKAIPKRFQKILFGQGGVQELDGEIHRHRKALFMKYMNQDSLKSIEVMFVRNWMQCVKNWEIKEQIILFDEAEQVLIKTVCEWTGVSLNQNETRLRAKQMSQMIDASGGIGWRHYKGRIARSQAEQWMKNMITEIRQGKREVSPDSVLHGFAHYKDYNNELADARVMAVEMLNLLRPVVAIARYVVFIVHALREHPEYISKLRNNDELIQFFVQEVRRIYPFCPFIAARTAKSFTWKKYQFKKNQLVLLDIYATNHDEKLWQHAELFYPERFKGHKADPFDMIPQGGGDFHNNHRCAGEWLTIRLMEQSLYLLINHMEFKIPQQDMSITLNRIPAIPKSRMIISEVKRIP